MRNQERQAAKEAAIKADYAALVAEKKYVKEYILDKVALKYHLQPSTVECIIYGHYEARRLRQAERDRLLGKP